MNTVFVKNYDAPPFNRKEILRYAMCKDADVNVTELMEACIAEVQGKLACKVCYITAGNEEYFKDVSSSVLNAYLDGCEGYVLFAATIGLEIDRLILRYASIAPAKAHMFQAIGAERVEALCDLFCRDMQTQYGRTKPRISPGYGDLPLRMQKEIFALLDCSRKIGLTLNDSMLMSPSKSVTAILGVSK